MPDLLVYLGAAVMVGVAILAYRYWNSTAEFARLERERQARLMHEALLAAAAAPAETDGEAGITEEAVAPAGEAAPGSPAPEAAADPAITGAWVPTSTGEVADSEDMGLPAPSSDEAAAGEERIEDDTEEPAVEGTAGSGAGPGEPEPEEIFEPDVAEAIAYRLIDELEPRAAGRTPSDKKTVTALIERLDDELAGLPTGLELMELSTVERRRIADRRRALEEDRARLLEHHKGGAHRRRRGRKNSG